MTTFFPPSSQTTLVVILGASTYPEAKEFDNQAFANSAATLAAYFLDTYGIPTKNLLNLFGREESPSEQEKLIGSFIEERVNSMRNSISPARDLILYYVGHGGFSPANRYYLFLYHSKEPGPPSTKLGIESLATTLKESARHLRRIVILDTCFAAEAQHAFGSPQYIVALRQTIAAFEEKDQVIETDAPQRGTSLLCASNQNDPAVTLEGASLTAFTEALLSVLTNGNHYLRERRFLSLRTIHRLMVNFLTTKYNLQVPRPEVHSPDQSEGDVADIPLFPNMAYHQDEALYSVVERERETEVSLSEEERPSLIETQAPPQPSQVFLSVSSPQTFMSPSSHEVQPPTASVMQFNLIKGIISGIRLSIFWIILILYWLLFGYMISDIFPKKILRISGSTYLYMLLRGEYRKTERLKILVVFFSLVLDWVGGGIFVSRIPHPNLFTVQQVLLYGPLLVGLFVFLSVAYVFLYYIKKWPYVNVINLRKTIEIIVVTALLTFISPTFGASFLYFPLFTSVISICLFIYGVISLGSAQHVMGSEVLNEKLERRLQGRLEDERLSKEYFKKSK